MLKKLFTNCITLNSNNWKKIKLDPRTRTDMGMSDFGDFKNSFKNLIDDARKHQCKRHNFSKDQTSNE